MLRPLTTTEKNYILGRIEDGVYSCMAILWLDTGHPEGTEQEFLNSYKEHSQARDMATGFKDISFETWGRLPMAERQHIRCERLKAWFEYLETFPRPRTHPELET